MLAVLAAFIWPRLHTTGAVISIDERIPLEVSAAMAARGNLDPNWALAPGLEPVFQYPQYNFYFYHITAHGVISAAHRLGGPPLLWLRAANLIWQLLAMGLLIDALRRLGSDGLLLLLTGALFAVAPGLVQDAHIIRTESLLLALTAASLWCATLPAPPWRRALAAGLFLGLAAAAKVTALSTGAALAVAGWWLLRRALPAGLVLQAGAALAGGTALGFALGAPLALVHPEVFLQGLSALQDQYSSRHPPHSMPVFSLTGQAVWIGRYFVELYGAALPLALASPLLVRGERRWLAAALLASFLTLTVLFVTKPVFFERNFAHAVPPLLAAAAQGILAVRPAWLRLVAAAACLLPMAYWATQIAQAVPEQASTPAMNAELAPDLQLQFRAAYRLRIPTACRLVAVPDYGDPWSATFLEQLRQAGFVEAGVYRSRFYGLSTSTLRTELGSDMHYFRCPPD